MDPLRQPAGGLCKFQCTVLKRTQCRLFWQHRFHNGEVHGQFMPLLIPVVYP